MSTFNLKLLAIITMFIDHTGAMLIPYGTPLYWVFRVVGRTAFPIFAFLIVEGYYHTHDVRKYMIRLALFAVISEIPFDLMLSGKAFSLSDQNVFFTLLAGLLVIHFNNRYTNKKYLVVSITLALVLAAEFLHTDYGAFGVAMIMFFHVFRRKRLASVALVGALNIIYGVLGLLEMGIGIQAFAAAAMIPIFFYNGEKGPSLKYFFYTFYPAHILLLYAIQRFFYKIPY